MAQKVECDWLGSSSSSSSSSWPRRVHDVLANHDGLFPRAFSAGARVCRTHPPLVLAPPHTWQKARQTRWRVPQSPNYSKNVSPAARAIPLSLFIEAGMTKEREKGKTEEEEGRGVRNTSRISTPASLLNPRLLLHYALCIHGSRHCNPPTSMRVCCNGDRRTHTCDASLSRVASGQQSTGSRPLRTTNAILATKRSLLSFCEVWTDISKIHLIPSPHSHARARFHLPISLRRRPLLARFNYLSCSRTRPFRSQYIYLAP